MLSVLVTRVLVERDPGRSVEGDISDISTAIIRFCLVNTRDWRQLARFMEEIHFVARHDS